MKITRKRVLICLLFALLVGGAIFGCLLTRAWKLYLAEDEIAHEFFPVVNAIYDYAEAQRKPPAQLSDLVPKYLAAIPQSAVVDSVSLKIHPDGQTWRLSMRSHVCWERRIYCWQSNHQFSQEEESRIFGKYHGGWTVMKEAR